MYAVLFFSESVGFSRTKYKRISISDFSRIAIEKNKIVSFDDEEEDIKESCTVYYTICA